MNTVFGIAVEGNVDYYAGQSEYSIQNFFLTNNANASESLDYGFGLYVLPRYHLSPTVTLFAGPGISKTRFETDSGAETGGNIGVTGHYREWLTGWGFKAGTGLAVTTNIDLTLTYQYTNFNSVVFAGVEPLTGSLVRGRYAPYSNTVMIGAAIHC